MTPKLFITVGAAFGLLLGFILGDGADWVWVISWTVTGGIVGFAVFPIRRAISNTTKKKIEDE